MCPNPARSKTRFHETVQKTFEFPKPTKEDEEASWYSDDEYDGIKESFQYAVFMMDMGKENEVENDDSTTLGLEKQTEEGAWERYEHKRDYYNAVLDEQDRQGKTKTKDADKIREAIADTTTRATDKARQRAQRVEDEISEYLNEARMLLFREPSKSKLGVSTRNLKSVDTTDLKEKNLKSLENLWDRQSGRSKRNLMLNDTTIEAKAGRTRCRKLPSRTLSLAIKRPSLLDTSATTRVSSGGPTRNNEKVSKKPTRTLSLAIKNKPAVHSMVTAKTNLKDCKDGMNDSVEELPEELPEDCQPPSLPLVRSATMPDAQKDSSQKLINRRTPLQRSGIPSSASTQSPDISRPKRTTSGRIAERISSLQENNERDLRRPTRPTARKNPPSRNPSSRMPSRGALAAMKAANIAERFPLQVEEERDHKSNNAISEEAQRELPNHTNSLSKLERREPRPMQEQKMTTSVTPITRRVPRRNPSSKIASRLRELQENNAKDLRRAPAAAVVSG